MPTRADLIRDRFRDDPELAEAAARLAEEVDAAGPSPVNIAKMFPKGARAPICPAEVERRCGVEWSILSGPLESLRKAGMIAEVGPYGQIMLTSRAIEILDRSDS